MLLYGSHSWNLSAAQLEGLEVLRRHQLRQIAGVHLSDRMRNEDLLRKCQQPSIAAQLRQRRGHWIGHVLRMGDDRLAKQLLYSSLDGMRRQGGQFQTLAALCATDMESVLTSKQRKDIAHLASVKSAWNELFAAKNGVVDPHCLFLF